MNATTAEPALAPAAVLHILLAAADPVTCALAVRLLQRLGHARPAQVEDRDGVLAAVSAAPVEVVLLDQDLPPAGGTAVARELAQTIGSRRPRVVLLHAGDTPATAADLDGVDGLVPKPLRLESLAQVLAAVCTADFDAATWAGLLQLFGRESVAQLVTAARADLLAQQRQLDAAIADGDAPALKRIAHGVRGTCLQLGASALATLGGQAEQAAAGGDAAQASLLLAQMLLRYRRLVEHLEDEIRRA